MPQGFLRADNGEIDACLPCKRDDTCRVIVTSDADRLRNGGDAGIFRFHERIKLWFLFRSHDGLSDGVFPCAVADKQNMGHQGISFRFCRSNMWSAYRKTAAESNKSTEGAGINNFRADGFIGEENSFVISLPDLISFQTVRSGRILRPGIRH